MLREGIYLHQSAMGGAEYECINGFSTASANVITVLMANVECVKCTVKCTNDCSIIKYQKVKVA